MGTCEDCKLEDRMKTAEEDIKDLQHFNNRQSKENGTIGATLDYIKKTLEDVKVKVDKLTEAPSKRWDTIINTAITGVTAALIAGIMSFIILGG